MARLVLSLTLLAPLLSLLLVVTTPSPALAVWPNPRNASYGHTLVALSPSFNINPPSGAPSDLLAAISRSSSNLRSDNLQILQIGRGANYSSAFASAHQLASLQIKLTTGQGAQKSLYDLVTSTPVGELDESYTLTVPADGSAATLEAANAVGALRGLTTFEQLFYTLPSSSANGKRRAPANKSNNVYTPNAPVQIHDKPAFPYRGFMLDTARNYIPVKDLKTTFDAMYMVKLNNFHWHVVDSQSFPLVVPGYEALSTNGAYSSDDVYTEQDVKDLVQYAAERGINIIPEIDLPGHTDIIYETKPDLVSCHDNLDWTTVANEPPSGQLTLNSTAARTYAEGLVSAVLTLFPGSAFSSGGDEVNLPCYGLSASDPAAADPYLKQWITGIQSKIAAKGRTPVVWEEMAITAGWNATAAALRNDTVVEVWTSSDHVTQVLANPNNPNLRLIHAPSDHFYLDCGMGEWIGNDPAGQSWCSYNSWQRMYTFDPLNGTQGIHNGAERVLGGEAALWTEQTDAANVHQYAWPRAATPAEVFWTGATGPDGKLRSVNEAMARMHDVRFRMVQRGIPAVPLQPLWCALRPTEQCNLPPS